MPAYLFGLELAFGLVVDQVEFQLEGLFEYGLAVLVENAFGFCFIDICLEE